MADFLSGATMMAAAAVALFFLRFWRRTHDPLFLMFALGFAVLTIERWILILVSMENEMRPYVYLARLVAFLMIIGGIVAKNRSARRT